MFCMRVILLFGLVCLRWLMVFVFFLWFFFLDGFLIVLDVVWLLLLLCLGWFCLWCCLVLVEFFGFLCLFG